MAASGHLEWCQTIVGRLIRIQFSPGSFRRKFTLCTFFRGLSALLDTFLCLHCTFRIFYLRVHCASRRMFRDARLCHSRH